VLRPGKPPCSLGRLDRKFQNNHDSTQKKGEEKLPLPDKTLLRRTAAGVTALRKTPRPLVCRLLRPPR
jgi:hypothetical protein